MPVAEAIVLLIQVLVKLAGGHEKARRAISEDEQRQANAAADAVAAARVLAEKV